MTPQVAWLVAFIAQIMGILLIGDDVILARQMARARPSSIVEDGKRASHPASTPTGHRPIKAIVGIVLLVAGLFLAFVAG